MQIILKNMFFWIITKIKLLQSLFLRKKFFNSLLDIDMNTIEAIFFKFLCISLIYEFIMYHIVF